MDQLSVEPSGLAGLVRERRVSAGKPAHVVCLKLMLFLILLHSCLFCPEMLVLIKSCIHVVTGFIYSMRLCMSAIPSTFLCLSLAFNPPLTESTRHMS